MIKSISLLTISCLLLLSSCKDQAETEDGTGYAGRSAEENNAPTFNRMSIHPPKKVNAFAPAPLTDVKGTYGIDVSKYQKTIDWQQVINDTAEGKITFVIHKATEGATYLDPNFKKNFADSKSFKLKTGAYHFFKQQRKAADQAKQFIKNVPLDADDFPPVLDIEPGCAKCKDVELPLKTLIKGLQTWVEIIEKHYGKRVIIYTTERYYSRYLKGSFPNNTFWIAKYNQTPPETLLLPNTEPERATIWQYTHKGKVNGIEGFVDLNFTAEDVSKW
jgi:lysozyme